jgi:hypothetical protein
MICCFPQQVFKFFNWLILISHARRAPPGALQSGCDPSWRLPEHRRSGYPPRRRQYALALVAGKTGDGAELSEFI